jgi:TPP-dependent pyruvate/acetoin dehydrogenase alpha subunit
LRGHVEYEVTFLSKAYRDDAEVEARRSDDPIARHRLQLDRLDGAKADIAEIERQVDEEVLAAIAYAKDGAWPSAATATRYMFS